MARDSILFLGTQMAVGGAQQVLFFQANWFHQQGYRVLTAFFYDKENLADSWSDRYPFPVIDLGAWKHPSNPILNVFSLVTGLLRLWSILRKERISIIETFTPDSNMLGLIIARLAKVPVRIASHHGVIEGRSGVLVRIHGKLINWGFANRLVVVSERVQQIAIQDEGVRPDKVQIILNGIPAFDPDLVSAKARAKLLDELDIKGDQPFVLSVGRVTEQKGHRYLLDAVPTILEKFPKTVFVIAGEGTLRNELQEKTIQMGIDQHVQFLGTRTDIQALLFLADVFVLPSISEGMPIALLEAMGMGVPTTASNLDQIAAFVEDRQRGILFHPKDSTALSESILDFLEDKNLRLRIGSAGQSLVQECYTVDQMCKAYERLFLSERGVPH